MSHHGTTLPLKEQLLYMQDVELSKKNFLPEKASSCFARDTNHILLWYKSQLHCFPHERIIFWIKWITTSLARREGAMRPSNKPFNLNTREQSFKGHSASFTGKSCSSYQNINPTWTHSTCSKDLDRWSH